MKKSFQKSFLLSLAVFIASLSMAQNKTLTGRVTGENGELIANATVVAQNSQSGTSTGTNGEFSITVPADVSVLVVSSVGYAVKEVPVIGSFIEVVLKRNEANLEEVVVVGYGTQKKSNITGAISSVKASDLENVPSGRIEQALQGRVSGVTIMQNSGQPGSGSTIQIRGTTTFNNNNPLWVVDGVVVDAGGIGYINQSDIE